MSTRSQIGLYDDRSGSLEYVYCHWDGDTNWVGQRLLGFYNTEQKVRDLLSHGNMSVLKNSIELSYFYEGEPSQKVRVDSLQDCIDEMLGSPIEFVYIYNLSAKKWVYSNDGRAKQLQKQPNSPVYEDFVTVSEVKESIIDILDRVGGDFNPGREMLINIGGSLLGVCEIKDLSSDIVITAEGNRKISIDGLTGYELTNLQSSMERFEEEAMNNTKHLERRVRRSSLNRARRNETVKRGEQNFYRFCERLDKELDLLGMEAVISVDDDGIAAISLPDYEWYFDISIEDGGASLQVIDCENGYDEWFGGIRDEDTEKAIAKHIVKIVTGDEYMERRNVRMRKIRRSERRFSRNEASMGEVADDAAARRYAEVDPKHCSKDEFMSRIQRGDLFIGRYYGTKYYFKVTGFRGGRVVLSSIGEKASGKLVPGVSEPLYMPDPSSRGSQKDAHAQPIKTYSGIELTSRDWSFEMWDGKWDFHDINGGLGF